VRGSRNPGAGGGRWGIENVVGIDLGTTNSSVAVFADGEVRVLPNALGEPLTPSVVAHDERSGTLLVGRTAKDILALRPDLGAAMFKRGMGTDRTWRVAGKVLAAVELSSLVLRSLKRDAEDALGATVDRAVISVPAYFDDAQRFATMKAGELAGFTVERIVNEPTAAAIAHGAHARENGRILVFDLGGGTFDVCVMDRFEGALEVRSVAGESRLGGEDFTRRLAAWVLDRLDLRYERAEVADPEALALLVKRAELLKRRLGVEEDAEIVVPPFFELLPEPRTVEVTREQATRAFEPLIRRFESPCRQAFLHAGLKRTDLNECILVGGATRMPCVEEFVREYLRLEPVAGVDPDLAVVHGAALQAALHTRSAGVGDLVVTDVASHSLGIGISKEFGGKRTGGFFMPIIHRNSVIPTSRVESVCTVEPNQRTLTLDVYEGESRHVKDNRHIGTLFVSNIPPGPTQSVDVRFTYDLNGILEVEAVVEATGEKFAKVFTRDCRILSPEEIEAARSRLGKIREDPRERPRIRDAMARAEGLLREVGPADRSRLEAALDSLEAALAERDPVAIKRMLEILEEVCEGLDGGERW
jgi:molecular chaperone HscC